MALGRGHSGPARRLLTLALGCAVLLTEASPVHGAATASGASIDPGALFDAVAGATAGALEDLLSSPTQLSLDGTTHDISPSTPWTRFEGPVNVVAGNLAFGVVDLSIPSVGFPTAMGRTYQSAATGTGLLGYRWSWSYGISAHPEGTDVIATWGDGRQDRHVSTGPDAWDPPAGVFDTLSRADDGTATITVTGSYVALVSTTGRDRGKAQVRVDGALVATFDPFSRSRTPARLVWTANISPGPHVIELRTRGQKRPAAKGTRVDLDAWLVLR